MKSLRLRARKSQTETIRLANNELVLITPAEGYRTYEISNEYPIDILNWLKLPLDYSYVDSCFFPVSSVPIQNSFTPLDYYIPNYIVINLVPSSTLDHIAVALSNTNLFKSFVVQKNYTNNYFMLHNSLYSIVLNNTEGLFTCLDPEFKYGITKLDFNTKERYQELMSFIPDEHKELNLSFYNPNIDREFDIRFSKLDKSHLIYLMRDTDNFSKGTTKIKFDRIDLIEPYIRVEFAIPCPVDTISGLTIWNRVLNTTIYKEYSFTKLKTNNKSLNIRNRLSNLYSSVKQEIENNLTMYGLDNKSLAYHNTNIELTYTEFNLSEININFRLDDKRSDWTISEPASNIQEEFTSRPYNLFEKFLLEVIPELSFNVENNDIEYKQFCKRTLTLYMYYLHLVNTVTINKNYSYMDTLNQIIIPREIYNSSSRTAGVDYPGLERLNFRKFILKIPEKISHIILNSIPIHIKNSYLYKIVDDTKLVNNTIDPTKFTNLNTQEVNKIFNDTYMSTMDKVLVNENKI